MIGRGAKGLVGGLAGKLGWGSKKAKEEEPPANHADEIQMKIYQVSDNLMDKSKPNRVEVCSGSGRWLSHFIIDNKVVWRIEEQVPQWQVRGDRMLDGTPVLPSDMESRPDIALMYEKKYPEAEAARAELTGQCRKDAELRKAAAKARGD
jgi:hypothetical protein